MMIKRQSPLLLKHQAMLLSCASHAVRTAMDSITSEEMSAMLGRKTTFPAHFHQKESPCSPCCSYTCIPWRTNSPYSSTLVKAWPQLLQHSCKLANSNGCIPLLTKKQEMQFALRGKQFGSRNARRKAAVLVPICSVQGVPSLLFTVRAAHLKHHASEVCFPGGHVEEIDTSFVDTALREANEELVPPPGLLRNVEILGHATPIPSPLRGTPVTPIIGVIWPDLPNPVSSWFMGNPSEVAAVFSVPIQELYENDMRDCNNNRQEEEHLVSIMGNQQDVIMKQYDAAPTFPTPFGDIWGLTASIIRPILYCILKPVFLASHENDENNIQYYGHHEEATRGQEGRRRRDLCLSNFQTEEERNECAI